MLLIVFYIAFTIFISVVIRSQSLAVGLGLVRRLEAASSTRSLLVEEKYPWLKWNPFNFMNIKEQIPSLLNSPDMQMTAFDPGLGYWEMAIGIFVYSVLLTF